MVLELLLYTNSLKQLMVLRVVLHAEHVEEIVFVLSKGACSYSVLDEVNSNWCFEISNEERHQF